MAGVARRRGRRWATVAGVVALGGGLASTGAVSTPVASASPGDLFVATSGNDANSCSTPSHACRTIGAAVSKAAPGDTIHVASGTYTTTSTISLGKSLTIQGAGATTTTVGGTPAAPVSGSVFHVDAGVTVSITGLTITGGKTGDQASGGGIENLGTIASLSEDVVVGNAGGGGGGIANRHTITTLTDDTVTGNTTTVGGGGGISNDGTIQTVSNDTISGNHAAHNGGGIQNGPFAGITALSHDTITGNTPGDGTGGGILSIPGGRMGVNASIVADNPGRNCTGSILDDGYNLEDTSPSTCGFTTGSPKHDVIGDPKLAPLANNGGTTPTRALLPGSPAIDVVPSSTGLCSGGDQRGVSYLQPGATGCDIGSFQVATPPAVASTQFGVSNQTDVFSIAPNGEVDVRWVTGAGKWNGPLAISSPGLAQPGSHLAASNQFGIPNQTDVFVTDNTGTVDVLWVQGAGRWNGPLAISPVGLAPAGAGLAASNQFGIPNQTDVFVVTNDRAISVSWVQGAGTWQGPLRITQTDFAPQGARLASSAQFGVPNQTDVFVVGNNGAIWVSWVQAAGTWQRPIAISPGNSVPGAGLTASRQFGLPNQTDVFVVENDGATHVSWVQSAGTWQGPLGITPMGVSTPGAGLTSSNQFGIPNQTDVWVVNGSGAVDVSWVQSGGAWNGPLTIGPSALAVPGAGLASSNQFGIPNQTDVWIANTSGAMRVFWVQNAGAWKGPLAI